MKPDTKILLERIGVDPAAFDETVEWNDRDLTERAVFIHQTGIRIGDIVERVIDTRIGHQTERWRCAGLLCFNMVTYTNFRFESCDETDRRLWCVDKPFETGSYTLSVRRLNRTQPGACTSLASAFEPLFRVTMQLTPGRG